MIPRERAEKLVQEDLDRTYTREPAAVLREFTEESPSAWIVYFNSRRYVETGNPKASLIGPGPCLVSKVTGAVHHTTGARPVEFFIDNFERYGDVYPPDDPSKEPSQSP